VIFDFARVSTTGRCRLVTARNGWLAWSTAGLTGIVLNDHTDARGELVFEQACRMGLEGIVSKRLSKPYQSGRSGHWLKVKNPDSPAMARHREGSW
jgi:hypothetical protein